MEHIKNIICGICGVVISGIINLFGGWDMILQTLIIFMMIDYITGFMVAAVFKKSKKTEKGGLASYAGWKGLCRKGVTLLIVLVAYHLDLVIGVDWIRDAVIIAFISNEAISIIENAGLMGIQLPSPIMNAVETLRGQNEEASHRDCQG